MSQTAPTQVKQTIEATLQEALAPAHLEVLDESHQHNVPPGAQSHFRVTAVAAAFDGEGLVARHRRVNHLLADQMQRNGGTVHALALHTYTPDEWAERQGSPESPPCLGGGKR